MAADLLFYVSSIQIFFIFLHLLFSGFPSPIIPDGNVDVDSVGCEGGAVLFFEMYGGTFYVFESYVQ